MYLCMKVSIHVHVCAQCCFSYIFGTSVSALHMHHSSCCERVRHVPYVEPPINKVSCNLVIRIHDQVLMVFTSLSQVSISNNMNVSPVIKSDNHASYYYEIKKIVAFTIICM